MFARAKFCVPEKPEGRLPLCIVPIVVFMSVFAATQVDAARLGETNFPDLTDSAGGTVSGSGDYLNGNVAYGHANAFDNQYGDDNSRVIFATATGWVAYTFKEPTVVDAFTIRVPRWEVDKRSPKRFTLSGSNDGGATWTLLDEETDQTSWTNQEIRGYGFENKTAYLTYKFEIVSNNGAAYAQFSELQFARISDEKMKNFVWQPTGVAKGNWTDDSVWVGASELSSSVYHYPTKEASVSFAGVQTPEVVCEIEGSRACSGLTFSDMDGLTNLVIRGSGNGAKLGYYGTECWAWPSLPDQEVALENITLEVAVNWTSLKSQGIFVLRDGAVVSSVNKAQIGAVGTPFQMRLEGKSSASLGAFGLSRGASVTIDDSTFMPRAMNLTWQGATDPGSVCLRGEAPSLRLERLLVSASGAVGDVVFEVPVAGYASAPIQQPNGTLQLNEPFANGDGTVRIVVDKKSPVFADRSKGDVIAVPLVFWREGIKRDSVALASLPRGSSFRWGWGSSGELDAPENEGDLPTALWLDAAPIPSGLFIFLR